MPFWELMVVRCVYLECLSSLTLAKDLSDSPLLSICSEIFFKMALFRCCHILMCLEKIIFVVEF